MNSIIIALSLFGMAYASGYGDLNLGYGGYDSGLSLDNGYKGGLILIKSDDRGYDNYDDGSYGSLDLGNSGGYGHFSPMPQQQIKLVAVPYPVAKPYPVPVDKPYTVKIDKPYHVKVESIVKKPYIAKVVRPVIEKTIHVETKSSHY